MANHVSPSDEMVRLVACPSGKHFNVHRSLLSEQAPNLVIHNCVNGDLQSYPTTAPDVLEIFAKWVYTGGIPVIAPGDIGNVIKLFIAAHHLGRELGCIGFMDTMLSKLIERLTANNGPFPLDDMINAFASEFARGSGGWNFAIHFLYSMNMLNCGNELASAYLALENVESEEFLTDLAGTIATLRNSNLPDDLGDPDLNNMIISGWFAHREYHGSVDGSIYGSSSRASYPWYSGKCQYHHHTELGLPCSASETE